MGCGESYSTRRSEEASEEVSLGRKGEWWKDHMGEEQWRDILGAAPAKVLRLEGGKSFHSPQKEDPWVRQMAARAGSRELSSHALQGARQRALTGNLTLMKGCLLPCPPLADSQSCLSLV